MPYVAGLLNCLLYVWYGLPFVTAHNILVTVSNGIGAALEFIYVILYLIFAPQKYRNKILIFFIIEVLIFGGIAVTSMVALHGKDRSLLVGIAAATLSVCMYASPLSIMRMVIKTKSVEYMPFFLSLFVFLCSVSWFIYGVLGKDLFVGIPNGIGSVLGAAQLLLYAIYRKPRPEAAKTASVAKEIEQQNDVVHSKSNVMSNV
eukprot:TRINITY_DN1298_c0_g1_i3.p1 TRINITY_DN1298_c0_g1~~TRINITY_DN1298_c0_g1_i3.p1  ORF type:complete len:203 (+),score=21.08 TRINITY_DN1298_c0_g1_i3:398-1006(+)